MIWRRAVDFVMTAVSSRCRRDVARISALPSFHFAPFFLPELATKLFPAELQSSTDEALLRIATRALELDAPIARTIRIRSVRHQRLAVAVAGRGRSRRSNALRREPALHGRGTRGGQL